MNVSLPHGSVRQAIYKAYRGTLEGIMILVGSGSEAESYEKATVLDAKGLGTHEDGGV